MSRLLAEQKRYYAERAPDYDDWWYRRGRYELPADALARWRADAAEAEAALESFAPLLEASSAKPTTPSGKAGGGTVLELAAGTGIWTRKLVRLAERVVAVDANAETLALNTSAAELVRGDVFEWEPTERFDLVFFSFWLSHVPEERFDEFWALVRAALMPGGKVFLVDSGAGDTAHTGSDQADGEETRSLSDGREFRIVKRRWSPSELADRVRPLGFALDLRDSTNRHFLYGGGRLP